MAGFHEAVLLPTPLVPVTTGAGVLARVIGVPVAVMVPVVVMEPGSYPTSVAGMVSAGVPPPVVQSVEEAVAVHEAVSKARSSVTATAPRAPLMVVPGAPLPRSEEAGAVMDKAPEVTEKVTVVSGSPLPAVDEFASTAGAAGAAEAMPGVSAMPVTAAAAKMLKADLIIVPPVKSQCPGTSTTCSIYITTLSNHNVTATHQN
jgi:hypothetical protein